MDPLGLTRELIGIDTCNPPGGEEVALRHLEGLLAGAGFEVDLDLFGEGRGSLVARYNRGATDTSLCFAGHIDTVPLGTAAWSRPPFGAEVHDGLLYGRGASDMKSGIAAMCSAAMAAAAEKVAGEIALFVCGAEETGCQGSFRLAADSGLLGRPGAMVVCEPSRNRPLLGHKGALWLQGRTAGKAAHGSMPELGDNALYKAVDAVGRLRAMELGQPPHAHLGPATMSINTLHAGQNTNSVPDEAFFTVDLRTLPGMIGPELIARLARTAGPDVEFDTLLDIPAVWTEADDPWVCRSFELLRGHLNSAPGIETVQFFTDASAFRQALPHMPIIILGPGDPNLAHRTDEYCEVRQIETAMRMYLDLCRDWVGA
jgi:succinyl-diaminopimelate desuccinylase